jgi:hypothetical protein
LYERTQHNVCGKYGGDANGGLNEKTVSDDGTDRGGTPQRSGGIQTADTQAFLEDNATGQKANP